MSEKTCSVWDSFSCVMTVCQWVLHQTRKNSVETCELETCQGQVLEMSVLCELQAVEDVKKAEKECAAYSHVGLGSSSSNMPLTSSDFSLTRYLLLP